MIRDTQQFNCECKREGKGGSKNVKKQRITTERDSCDSLRTCCIHIIIERFEIIWKTEIKF